MFQTFDKLDGREGVETARGLVDQQDGWIRQEFWGDGETFPLTTGKTSGRRGHPEIIAYPRVLTLVQIESLYDILHLGDFVLIRVRTRETEECGVDQGLF